MNFSEHFAAKTPFKNIKLKWFQINSAIPVMSELLSDLALLYYNRLKLARLSTRTALDAFFFIYDLCFFNLALDRILWALFVA